MPKFFNFQLLCLLFPFISLCQEYFDESFLRYEDFIYRKNIKTVQLFVEGLESSNPLIELNTSSRFVLRFDDLDSEVKEYRYSFIHCDAGWNPSTISETSFINGMGDNRIENHEISFNSFQKYIHYEILFPDENLNITKAGNYIIKIYEGSDNANLVLTRRFMVLSPKVTIAAEVKRATSLDLENISHEIDFEVIYGNYSLGNPYNDVKTIITQNNRWDNAITNLKPLFIREDRLVYDYNKENTFIAGNEFRRIDFRSFRYMTERVKDITFSNNRNHVYLLADKDRSNLRYEFDQKDFNGAYYIMVQEGDNNTTEADYAYLHFKIPYPTPLHHGNLYIFGALTDWKITREFQMQYNYERLCYEVTLYLKQGYYNYQYAFVNEGKKTADVSVLEGSHIETNNDYAIYVYNYNLSGGYDELVGYKTFNSGNILR